MWYLHLSFLHDKMSLIGHRLALKHDDKHDTFLGLALAPDRTTRLSLGRTARPQSWSKGHHRRTRERRTRWVCLWRKGC